MVIHEWFLPLFGKKADPRMDTEAIVTSIRRYAQREGLNPSDCANAISVAIRDRSSTVEAILRGRQRCDEIRRGKDRFSPIPDPPAAA